LFVALGLGAAAFFSRAAWLPLVPGYAERRDSERSRVAAGAADDVNESASENNSAPRVVIAGDKTGKVDAAGNPLGTRPDMAGSGAGSKTDSSTSGSKTGGATDAAKTGKPDPKDARPAETKPKKKGPEPPPAVETQEGKQLNASLDGYLISCTPAKIDGFAFDSEEREAEVHVSIFIDEAKAFDLKCETREQHKDHGIIWRFAKELPEGLQDNEQHRVRAYAFRKDKPGRKELRWSPRDVKLNSFPTGKLEEASPEKGISGYAWDPDDPKTAIAVRVKIDGEQIGEIKASVKNELLLKRKIAPNDVCAFKLDWPALLDDGREHTVQTLAVDLATGTEVELPGSPRVIEDRGGVANKAPIGAFDIANKAVLAGWAWDEDAPTAGVQVEIWIDDSLFTTVSASSKRDGLAWSKVTPDPNHGWTLTTPGILLDDKTHTIRTYALNTPAGVKIELQGSPRTYRKEENSAPMGSYWHADENWLRGWAADPDLGTEPCDIEIYIDGKLWTRVKANTPDNSLVGTGYAPNPEHGIAIVPPESVKDGKTHDVTIYAVNYPEGPATNLGTRTIGKNSIIAGFWVQDKLVDTRIEKGLYVTSVSPWFDAYHKDVKVGDVMLEYDGKIAGDPGTMSADFNTWLQSKKKDDIIHFKFWRNGNTYECDIKLGQTIGS
jgi:hypothetical protein